MTRSEMGWPSHLHHIVLARLHYISHSYLTASALHHVAKLYVVCHYHLLGVVPHSSIRRATNILECMGGPHWTPGSDLLQGWLGVAVALLWHVRICHWYVWICASRACQLVATSLQ